MQDNIIDKSKKLFVYMAAEVDLAIKAFRLYVLIFTKGYSAYHRVGNAFPLETIRAIYKNVSGRYEFQIAWDMYYLELTLMVVEKRKLAGYILLVRENIANLLYVFRNSTWRYCFKTGSDSEKYEVYFRNNDRKDKSPFLGWPELSVCRENCKVFLPKTNPCALTIQRVFEKRIELIKDKFELCKIPKVIIIEEGQSVEQRALYKYAIDNNTEVEFSWRRASSQVFPPEELSCKGNLTYPGVLHRPTYRPVSVVKLNVPIVVDLPVLLVVPTFSDSVEIIQWIKFATEKIIAPSYRLSIHPTFGFLRSVLIREFSFEVDDHKLDYLDRYQIFVGCYSTLLQAATERRKKVFAIAFSKSQLEGINGTHSEMVVYDAT